MKKNPTHSFSKALKKSAQQPSKQKESKSTTITNIEKLYSNIRTIIEEGRNNTYKAVIPK